jgi:hypothetical protein
MVYVWKWMHFVNFASRSQFFSFAKSEFVFGLIHHHMMLSFVQFGRRVAAVLLVVSMDVWLGAAIEDQQLLSLDRSQTPPREQTSWHTIDRERSRDMPPPVQRQTASEPKNAAAPSSLSPRRAAQALGVPRINGNNSLRGRDDVCSRYLDDFAPEYKCVSTASDFVLQLMDDKVSSILLCHEFVYTPTTTLNLSEQTKSVICQGKSCVIDGSKFIPTLDSAFTASGYASLFFCGVDFVNFFDMVSFP